MSEPLSEEAIAQIAAALEHAADAALAASDVLFQLALRLRHHASPFCTEGPCSGPRSAWLEEVWRQDLANTATACEAVRDAQVRLGVDLLKAARFEALCAELKLTEEARQAALNELSKPNR